MVWDVTACLAVWWKDPERWRHDTVFEFVCDLTVACVCVTQGLLSVQSYADVPSVGRCGAVTGARALVVTAAATHWALRPGWPAGPCTFYWNIHTHTHTHKYKYSSWHVIHRPRSDIPDLSQTCSERGSLYSVLFVCTCRIGGGQLHQLNVLDRFFITRLDVPWRI